MVVITVRLLSIVLGSYGGFRVAVLLNENYIHKDPLKALAIIIGILLGLLTGYVLGGVLGRYTAGALGGLEALVFKASGAEIFFGAIGVIFGLAAAALASIALMRFGMPGHVASAILFLAFGFLGSRVAFIKRTDLASLFKMGPVFGPVTGAARWILDTSVIIDGRVVDIAKAGFLDGTLVVPRFVLNELQSVADSADALKRSRGRRGLEVLNSLQRMESVRVEVADRDFPEIMTVDGKLVEYSKASGMQLVTNDFNLNRVAEIQGVRVLNINELANAMKPVVLPGEEMAIKIIREGKERGQGVGYLDDGTMVVVENGSGRIGDEVTVTATSVLQTPAGKMIFTELEGDRQEG